MNKSELTKIEKELNISLPAYYKDIMLNYPFSEESFANEFLLPNDIEHVIEMNKENELVDKSENPFFVGSDGGEEYYFIKTKSINSSVYVFDLEKGKHSMKADSFQVYLNQIDETLKEIEADEKAEIERKKNKKWWQFWI